MPIIFDSERRIFKIDSLGSSYAIGIFDGDFLVQLYYGKKIPDTNLISTAYRGGFASISPLTASKKPVPCVSLREVLAWKDF